MRAWVWDFIDGDWIVAERGLLNPGRIVCVAADSGGYRVDRGFDPDAEDIVPVVPLAPLPTSVEVQLHADESQDGEDSSAARWKTIGCHTGEVVVLAKSIGHSVHLANAIWKVLVLAAWWHDVGKAHPAFQGAIRLDGRPRATMSPRRHRRHGRRHQRPTVRRTIRTNDQGCGTSWRVRSRCSPYSSDPPLVIQRFSVRGSKCSASLATPFRKIRPRLLRRCTSALCSTARPTSSTYSHTLWFAITARCESLCTQGRRIRITPRRTGIVGDCRSVACGVGMRCLPCVSRQPLPPCRRLLCRWSPQRLAFHVEQGGVGVSARSVCWIVSAPVA